MLNINNNKIKKLEMFQLNNSEIKNNLDITKT